MGTSLFTEAETAASISTFYQPGTWIEGRAEDQLSEAARLPGMTAIAAFPDLHPGRHGPVGAAFLASRIFPQIIGPDIGCGMSLFRLDLKRRKLKIDKALRRLPAIEDPDREIDLSEALEEAGLDPTATAGLGSIGGGNHFCELQAVDDIMLPERADAMGLEKNDLLLLVHSGSRGHGARVFTGIEETWREGFLPESDAARDYIALHDAATTWARLNRRLIARKTAHALRSDLDLICDAPHNHLQASGNHWLHRKGAAAPDRGLAPLAGSRETPSYLLDIPADGPTAALGSVSHGAGRRYDRASMHGRIPKTRSSIDAMQTNRYGGRLICADRDLMIEEAGHAYKDSASVVIDLAHFNLARPVARMIPLLTYKTSGGSQ